MAFKTLKKLFSFEKLSAYPRLRALLIFGGIVGVTLVIVTLLSSKGSDEKQKLSSHVNGNQHLLERQKDYEGNQASYEYRHLVSKNQADKLKSAKEDGNSFFGSTGSKEGEKNASADKKSTSDQSKGKSTSSDAVNYKNTTLAQSPRQFADSSNNLNDNLRRQREQEAQREQLALSSQMEAQIKNIAQTWSISTQQTVSGAHAVAKESEQTTDKKADAQDNGPVIIKAGDVLFAVLTTQLNSDQESTPVMAEIVAGKFRGARILGTFKRAGDKLVVQFNKMSIKEAVSTISINAYAINSRTAENALASSVDHHYLLRYGSLFAAAFLEGFGDYYLYDSNYYCYGSFVCYGDDTNTAGGSTKYGLYSGLGEVGEKFADNMEDVFNRPPTVTLDQGTGLGILFMDDVKL